jgi:hypothetical protein
MTDQGRKQASGRRDTRPFVMTNVDIVTEARAALAPMEVLVVARSAFGGLVAVVAVPPAERLQGSVADFLKEQLRSLRATASEARADRVAKAVGRLERIEWALEQSGAAAPPAVVPQVATSTETVQVCEATKAARLIEQSDPLWLSVLLPATLGGELLYESDAWQSLRGEAEAQPDAFVGEQLLRRCARAAFGRCKALLCKTGDKTKKKTKTKKTKKKEEKEEGEEEAAEVVVVVVPEVPAAAPRGGEALVEWRAIVTLLCAGEAAAVCSGHAVPAVPASVRSAFARQLGGAITAAEGVEGLGSLALAPEVEELHPEVEVEVEMEVSRADQVEAEVEGLCAAHWKAADAAGTGGDALAQKERVLRRRALLEAWLDAQAERHADAATPPPELPLEPPELHLLPPLLKPPPSLPPPPPPPPSGAEATSRLRDTLQQLGVAVDPSHVVHGTRTGSYMYNLHTAASDEDYHFVF